MTARDDTLRLELCVASLHPAGAAARQEAVIDELRALEERGRVDEVDVVVWGDRVGLGTAAAATDAGRRVHDRLDACLAWEEASDRSLRPCFDVRELRNRITDEACAVIDLPSMLLVEYEGGDVERVTPSSDGASVETVTDRLRALATGAGDPDPSTGEPPDASVGMRRRPRGDDPDEPATHWRSGREEQ